MRVIRSNRLSNCYIYRAFKVEILGLNSILANNIQEYLTNYDDEFEKSSRNEGLFLF